MKTIYISKIQRVGSSSAVVIPVDVLNGYNWQRGDYVVFGFAGDNSLFIKKLSDRELEELKPKFITI